MPKSIPAIITLFLILLLLLHSSCDKDDVPFIPANNNKTASEFTSYLENGKWGAEEVKVEDEVVTDDFLNKYPDYIMWFEEEVRSIPNLTYKYRTEQKTATFPDTEGYLHFVIDINNKLINYRGVRSNDTLVIKLINVDENIQAGGEFLEIEYTYESDTLMKDSEVQTPRKYNIRFKRRTLKGLSALRE